MDFIFNILSASAKIDKSQRSKKQKNDRSEKDDSCATPLKRPVEQSITSFSEVGEGSILLAPESESTKLIHEEHIAAFRRSMCIRIANKDDSRIPDPISSFDEISLPNWWKSEEHSFSGIARVVQHNIDAGRWKEPTAIQMQAIPILMDRRDLIGCSPTGSGKSGAFMIPSLLLSSCSYSVFYSAKKSNRVELTSTGNKRQQSQKYAHEGEIRSLLLAPSLELACQLHREVERLGIGKPGGLTSALLSKSNAAQIIAGSMGGKKGLDVLVATPLRLVDSIEKGLRLDAVRILVLDEADRLLDATDGSLTGPTSSNNVENANELQQHETSSDATITQRRAFLSQIDILLSQIPTTAVRALFSATITPIVRSLAESFLRNPVDVTIAPRGKLGCANPDIDQKLLFVGREEGKLLAIRQMVSAGELRPPVLIFLESQERAAALFGELLYDGIHVDVIHAGRSRSARENAVARFRKGDTWVLICTDLVARGVDFRAVNMVINYDLPSSGVSYVHRIGRTGRAGRKGKAITFFTESDFDQLRTIANIMKQSGCNVEDWMLNLSKRGTGKRTKKWDRPRSRDTIDTTPKYDKVKKRRRQQIIQQSKKARVPTSKTGIENL